jgi:ribose 5-phosphate isomerase RpiB
MLIISVIKDGHGAGPCFQAIVGFMLSRLASFRDRVPRGYTYVYSGNGSYPATGSLAGRSKGNAANKAHGVRAALVHDVFSAHQGMEDDDMNLLCLGGRVVGWALAWDLIQAFLAANFSGAERHLRRLGKIAELEGE